MYLLHKIAEFRNTVGVLGVFEQSLVWSMILQPKLHTSTLEA